MATREQIKIAARAMHADTKHDVPWDRLAPILASAYERQAKAALNALKKAGWKLVRARDEGAA